MRLRLTITLAAAAIVAAAAASSGPATAANTRAAVFPAAGCPVASHKTQISFRGLSPGGLNGISVRGSSSGSHGGKLKLHSDGQGASFVPDKPFRAGETVTVKAGFPMIGESNGAVTFKIARPPGKYDLPVQGDPGGDPKGAQHFRSRPDLKPPSTVITKRDPSSSGEGDIFLAAKAGPGQNGPMISDESGRLIWFKQIGGNQSAFDFRAQTYRGNAVITWWQGTVRSGLSSGVDHILDSSYRTVANVHAGNGYSADLHEFEISQRSTALVLAYKPVTYSGRTSMDTIVQELDIPTGLVMFEWHALGQISSSESYIKYGKTKPLDVAHLNSIELVPDGNFLISARNTSAVYKLNHRTGRIMWRLGGKHSDFTMKGSSRFISQHHARLQPDGSITLYDNGAPPKPGRESRALWLNVNESTRTVSVRRSYRYPNAISSPSQGSMQILPGNHVFVGWGGDTPRFTEFTRGGNIIFDGHFKPTGDDSYRAFRMPWSAVPDRPPDAVATNSGGKTHVYASWNGATGVAKWQVLLNDAPIQTVDSSGFETHIALGTTVPSLKVRALDRNNQPLGTSQSVQPSG